MGTERLKRLFSHGSPRAPPASRHRDLEDALEHRSPLGPDADDGARVRSSQSSEEIGYERPEFVEAAGPRHENNHRNSGGAEVLLEREILIDGEESPETLRNHEANEFTITLT